MHDVDGSSMERVEMFIYKIYLKINLPEMPSYVHQSSQLTAFVTENEMTEKWVREGKRNDYMNNFKIAWPKNIQYNRANWVYLHLHSLNHS